MTNINEYNSIRPVLKGILGFILYLRFTTEVDEYSMKIALEQASEFLCTWEASIKL